MYTIHVDDKNIFEEGIDIADVLNLPYQRIISAINKFENCSLYFGQNNEQSYIKIRYGNCVIIDQIKFVFCLNIFFTKDDINIIGIDFDSYKDIDILDFLKSEINNKFKGIIDLLNGDLSNFVSTLYNFCVKRGELKQRSEIVSLLDVQIASSGEYNDACYLMSQFNDDFYKIFRTNAFVDSELKMFQFNSFDAEFMKKILDPGILKRYLFIEMSRQILLDVITHIKRLDRIGRLNFINRLIPISELEEI